MRKNDERLQLRRVFGDEASAARDHESPDFLVATPCGETLGVEVTSLYASNSEAKLTHAAGYTDALLDRTSAVHRADLNDLRVDDLTIIDKDGATVDTVVGIIRSHPSPREQMRLLFARIAEKEARVSEYLQSCSYVDLIVTDESRLFLHGTHEEFYRRYQLLFPRRRLLSSPFREIYLLTSTSDFQDVFIPLIGNALASDCLGYLSLLEQPEHRDPDRNSQDVLTASLLNDGHTRVSVSTSEGGTGYSCGAWEIFLDDEKFAIRNWMLPHAAYPGRPLADAVAEMSPHVTAAARQLTTTKRRSLAMIDMRLPAHV